MHQNHPPLDRLHQSKTQHKNETYNRTNANPHEHGIYSWFYTFFPQKGILLQSLELNEFLYCNEHANRQLLSIIYP